MARSEVCEEVWCLKCKSQGYDKDHFPVFANYVVGGGLVPLRPEAQAGPGAGPMLWCVIFQVVGKYVTDNCHLLQKFIQTPQQIFCNFCQSIGHNEHNCRFYELIMERTPTYQNKTKTWHPDQGVGGAGRRVSGAHTRRRWRRACGWLRASYLLQVWRSRTLCTRMHEPDAPVMPTLHSV